MLDVHPPHESTHSWKDFFIHIATIVVGLLIAIGLEQSVEFLHHRHQLHQAREQIRAELETNLEWNRSIDGPGIARLLSNMDRNIGLLRAAEAGHTDPNGAFDFSWHIQGFNDGAYRTARENGSVSLMPYPEAETYSDMYEQQQITLDSFLALIAELKTAQAVTLRGHTLAQMSPAEIQELLAACSAVKGKAISASEWTSEFRDEATITLRRMDAYR